jgi:uncharacterized protein (UPF0332 family)
MSVNAIAFLRTADLLIKQTEEAHLRTSIGRSYYAALLYFRERLKKIGLEKTKQPSREAHTFVIKCLEWSQLKEGNKASRYLRDLQQVREDADYDLETNFSRNDAEDAFLKAQKVIDDYEKNITTDKEMSLFINASASAKLKDWL